MNTNEVILLAFCTVVGLNIYASFRLLRSHSFETSQKIALTILIWALPVLKSLWILYYSDDGRTKG